VGGLPSPEKEFKCTTATAAAATTSVKPLKMKKKEVGLLEKESECTASVKIIYKNVLSMLRHMFKLLASLKKTASFTSGRGHQRHD
jgi:hypothetical protein